MPTAKPAPAPKPSPEIIEMQRLMREGRVNEADALATKTIAAQKAAAGIVEEIPPREPNEILRDLFGELVLHLGNHPRLTALLAEFDVAIERAAPPPAPEEEPQPQPQA